MRPVATCTPRSKPPKRWRKTSPWNCVMACISLVLSIWLTSKKVRSASIGFTVRVFFLGGLTSFPFGGLAMESVKRTGQTAKEYQRKIFTDQLNEFERAIAGQVPHLHYFLLVPFTYTCLLVGLADGNPSKYPRKEESRSQVLRGLM